MSFSIPLPGCGSGAGWAPPAVQLYLLVFQTDSREAYQLSELRTEHQTNWHLCLRESDFCRVPWLRGRECITCVGNDTGDARVEESLSVFLLPVRSSFLKPQVLLSRFGGTMPVLLKIMNRTRFSPSLQMGRGFSAAIGQSLYWQGARLNSWGVSSLHENPRGL